MAPDRAGAARATVRERTKNAEIAQLRYGHERTSRDDGRVDSPPRSVRVLVVDDAPAYRAVASDLLRLRGYDVVGWAASGVEALEAVDRLAPGAVLVDVDLPDVDGFTLAAQLKRRRADLAVLLVSADHRHAAAADHELAFVFKADLAKVDLSARLS